MMISRRRGVLAGLLFVWAGMLLGISFLEAPVKFRAPSLSLPVALDVGRTVFGAFEKVQVALSAATILVLVWTGIRSAWVPLGVAVASTAAQALWLRPILDARVAVILAGGTSPPTSHHAIFIAVEALKLLALLGAATTVLRSSRTQHHRHANTARRRAHAATAYAGLRLSRSRPRPRGPAPRRRPLVLEQRR